ncbi:MAG: D-alanine--D-alanine ligase [Pseudomonadota bacterium]
MTFGKVAVLYGGRSAEREVSLASGQAIATALDSRGVDAQLFDPAERALTELVDIGVSRVWNALHGGEGEDGRVQGALAMLGIPFTGSGVLGSALAMDKQRSKMVLAAQGIPVPDGFVVHADQTPREPDAYPVFVKPVAGGSSLGTTAVTCASAYQDALSEAFRFDREAMVEPQLQGPEMTVGVIGSRALPSIRIEAANAFYDYDAKYASDATRFVCPGSDDSALEAHLTKLALASVKALGCRGWARVDFMLDAQGNPHVLEVNTVPGMTDHSLVPHAAKVAGIDFAQLCLTILESA